ncbi:hypothetical protein B5F77_13190 [Parabacteroides sp. An277]|uniref:hypothetical protein n=1 Tax=Parabacteroides sp. An277 TaxID=1965619 RepID=UPI000B393F9D|nr:hypothetical protein [Parabacteroides sp. An277]OUO50228.1 hypothetical protein B5F77_13190 [Parabacteroides sp. An277]
MKTNKLYKLIVPLLFLAGSIGVAWGQGNNDKDSYSNVTITHKKTGGVWYDTTYQETHSRNQGSGTDEDWLKDTFDEQGDTTLTANSSTIIIQKTHEYRDTIYMFPEETRELILPDIMAPSKGAIHLSLYNYQRWYDYTTDGYSEHIKVIDDDDNSRGGCGYKFANGLVGGTFLMENISGNAFDQGLYRVNFTMPLSPFSDGYIIACDASNYTDVTKPTSTTEETEMEEPTLSQRAIFVILPATEIQSKLTTTTWFQDDTIHFPTKSVGKTDEQVALAMAARNYRTSDSDNSELNCSITYPTGGNSNFLTLSDDSKNISGNTRKVSFIYNNKKNESATGPKDGDIAYIEVKKGEYKIARFTLIFDAYTEALTQEEVQEAEGNEENENNFRTNAYLENNYTLLTKLDLDYTNVASSDNNKFYPYPMNWEFGSYAFYTKASGSGVKYTDNPQWGEYAITSTFPFAGGSPALLPGSKYHLYVDANEYPGTICTVPFREELCPGASLYVTYWMMSTANNKVQCDASVIFVLKGIEEDGTKTVIHRQASGQIPYNRNTTTISDGKGNQIYEGAPSWNQLYFTFVNGVGDKKFVSYELEMQSNNANTNGADCIIDDIRVYMQNPTARVEQQKLACGESTRLRMDLNWDQLLKRLGLEETTESKTDNYIEFCFIDRDIYDAYLSSHPNETNKYDKAVEEATVVIGRDLDLTVGRLYYDLKYENNTEYTTYDQSQDENGEYGSLAKNNTKNETSGETTTKYFFYKSKDNAEEKQLSVDFYADMSQGRRYTMLIRDDGDMEFGYPGEHCAITTEFEVEGQSLIKMNGQVVKPSEMNDYCTGQIFEFAVQMRYYDTSLKENVPLSEEESKQIYFDWFFGTENVFNGILENEQTESPSLGEALKKLRDEDKTASASLQKNAEGRYTLETTTNLTENEKAVIEKYLNLETEDGLHPQLVLHEQKLNIRILEEGLDLVVAPIEITLTTNKALCFSPLPFTLIAANKAPQIQPGFEYMDYGEMGDEYEPAMRIGLQQIKDSKTNAITVNLRNAQYAFAESEYESGSKPTHIGLLYDDEDDTTPTEGDNYIYLTDSDDPALTEILHPTGSTDFDRKQYIIGTVESLNAVPVESSTTTLSSTENAMTIKFKYEEKMDENDDNSPTFNPREGYYYTFTVQIEEHTESHSNPKGACRGNFNLTMKVVPEYLVWQGKDNTKNWNNDANWKRALNDDIKASDKIEDYENDNRGFVPMLFSKVIIPKDCKVELYKAGFKGEMDKPKNMKWETTINDLEQMEKPSISVVGDDKHPIQYDMMVYEDEEGNLSTKPYRVNLCDQIHFEPKAEMLHAELLDYNKAWVDYKLESGKWHTLASPLQGVVAGDFYTDSETATEEQEYFTDIEFSNTESTKPNGADKLNSRISPSVYQRGWDKNNNGAQMITTDGTSSTRAVQGNWSAVYNNVYDEYKPGEGFSLKVLDMPDNNGTPVEDAIFRLPKADDSYNYYTVGDDNQLTSSENSNNGSMPDSRKNAGKLQITPDDDATESESLHIVILIGDNQYYLIGNPFMAHLNMEAFLNGNNGVGSAYWFNDEDGVQNIISVSENDWITTGSTTAPLVPPLRSFFVRKADNATEPVSVTFTKNMQVLGTATEDETNTNALILTAQTADGKTSRAAIAYDATAKATYETDEDAELFLDSNLSDVPAIYTVAGTMATSINRTSELYNIPVGIYGNSTEMVTLSFEGLNHFSSATLYDAEEKTETPLREGTTLTVPASTSGRYFLRAGTPTANEVIETSDIQIYTLSGNRVMVTSNVPLKDIRVYTMNGAQVKHTKAGVCSFELYLADGIYLITAQNTSGETQTEKVVVR